MAVIRWAVWGVVLVGIAGALPACLGAHLGDAPAVTAGAVVPIQIREAEFPNGLRVTVETVDESSIAGAVLAVDAGAKLDPPDHGGVSHAVEHLVYRSRYGELPAVKSRLNALGAHYNAETSLDSVVYHAFARAQALPDLLQVFANVAEAPLSGIQPAVFEQERRIVEAERGLRTEHSQGQIDAWLLQSVYAKDDAYARPVAGTERSLAALTLVDLQAFAASYYRPERMALYVLAPRSLDAFRLINDAFGATCGGPAVEQPAPPSAFAPSAPALNAPGQLVRHGAAVASSELWLSWPLPGSTLAERAQAELFADAANLAITPTFTQPLDVPSATCGATPMVATELVSCRIVLKPGSDAQSLAGGILGEMRHHFAQLNGRRDFRWTLTRSAMLRRTFAEESPEARATRFGRAAVEYRNPLFERDLSEALDSADFEGMLSQGFARFVPEKTYMMLVEPLPGALPAPAVARGIAAETPNLDGSVGDAPALDPALTHAALSDFEDLHTFTLPNGLTVIAKRWAGTPFTSAVLAFRGGSSWAKTPAIARAAAAADVWKLRLSPEQRGMQANRWAGRDDQNFSVRSVSSDIDKCLELLDTQRSPHVEWPNLAFRRKLPGAAAVDASPDLTAERRAKSLLLGEHPYSAFASAQSADSVSVQALYEFFDSVRRPDNAVLTVVSDAPPEAVQAAALEHFGSWQNPSVARVVRPAGISLRSAPAAVNPVVVVQRPAATQTDFRVECLLPQADAQALPAELMLGDTLRRYLEDQLRERTGVAYFVESHVDLLSAGASLLSLTTSVANQHLAQALPFVHRVLEQPTMPFSEQELAWVKWQWVTSSALQHPTTDALAHDLAFIWAHELSPADLAQNPARVSQITLPDLSSLLSVCQKNAVLSVIGDQRTIEGALGK